MKSFVEKWHIALVFGLLFLGFVLLLGVHTARASHGDGSGHSGEAGGALSGAAAGDIDMGGNLLTDTTQVLSLGTACTTARSGVAGDVCVGTAGQFEVQAVSYFDGQTTHGAALNMYNVLNMFDDRAIRFGNSYDATMFWSAQSSPHALTIGLGAESRILYLIEDADKYTAWSLAQQTNPTLVIQSADATTEAQRLYLQHNQTDGVIQTGAGDINLVPAGGEVNITGDLTLTTYTQNQFVTSTSALLGATAPTDDTNESCYGKKFDADGENVQVIWIIPTCWTGTDITLEVRWCNENGDAIADTETVKFDVSYRTIVWATEDADNGTLATATTTHTQSGAGGAAETYNNSVTLTYNHADQPLTAGDHILLVFDRDVTGDTYSGGTIVAGFGFEFDCGGIPDHT